MVDEYKKYEYSSEEDGNDYLDIGGMIDFLGSAGDAPDSQLKVRNMKMAVEYGPPQQLTKVLYEIGTN